MAVLRTDKEKVLTFGELLLRITPDANGDWLKENTIPFYVGGAELNVASALALWGIPAKYVTALPGNAIAAQVEESVKSRGVELTAVHNDHRLGLYFLTKGKDLKNDALVYDRADSAYANLQPGDLDWEKLFEGVSWFHFSAICPAINQTIADICLQAVRVASSMGITVSIDLNYRAKLWKYGKTPKDIMPALVQHADLVMGNIWSAQTMLGIPIAEEVTETGQKSIYLKNAQLTSQQIIRQFPKVKAVANTFRFDTSDGVDYYATLYTSESFYSSGEHQSADMISKVGSGDCFMAGLIYGFYNEKDPQQVINFAAAAAFAKLFVISDATTSTVEQIKADYEKQTGN